MEGGDEMSSCNVVFDSSSPNAQCVCGREGECMCVSVCVYNHMCVCVGVYVCLCVFMCVWA